MTAAGPPGPGVVALFFGWLLIAVGVLVALLCGACTVLFWISFLGESAQSDPAPMMIMTGFVGGLPTLGGLGLIALGWLIVRRRRRPRSDTANTFR